jgi:hypothetical protein
MTNNKLCMLKKAGWINLLFLWICANGLKAQNIPDSSATRTQKSKEYPQEDLTDILKVLLKKPIKKDINPTPAMVKDKPYLSVFPAIGYTLQTRLAAVLAGNVAFYLEDPKTTNLSSITSSVAYTQNNQVTLPVQSNIWIKNNKFNFQGDWRFYKYPQNTYGLGSNNSLDSDADKMDYSYIRFYSVLLRNIGNHLYLGGGYDLDYHWDIDEAGYTDGRISDYKLYGAKTKTTSSGYVCNLLFDSRTNSVNSSGGAYANIVYRSNVTWLGSNSNWQSLLLDLRKYVRLPANSNNVLGFWSYNWLVLSGKPPYLDLPSTSWDTYTNTGRGYIQGRFRSYKMLYLESEYRFQLTHNGLLGGVVFANAQAFSEWPENTNTFNKIQPAVGAGLRVKLNKNSKTNLDIDYGIGTRESHGLFVNIGEVF